MKLLQIDSSARTSSVTRRLTANSPKNGERTIGWRSHPARPSATAIPLITDAWGATYLEDSQLTLAQRSYLSTSDALIEELAAADAVVIGSPMYNFSIPSSLKAWIDQIVRLGKTVSYAPNGPQAFSQARELSSSLPRERL